MRLPSLSPLGLGLQLLVLLLQLCRLRLLAPLLLLELRGLVGGLLQLVQLLALAGPFSRALDIGLAGDLGLGLSLPFYLALKLARGALGFFAFQCLLCVGLVSILECQSVTMEITRELAP